MTLLLALAWVVGVTSFTLLGSLYARRSGRADLLIGLFVSFVRTAQMLAVKIAQFDLGSIGAWSAPAGVLIFSVTFLFTDIVNERFGRKEAQRMIFIAFIAQVAMAFFIWLGTQFDSDPMMAARGREWDDIFSLVPQITFASWVAFLVSENIDAYIFSWLKKATGGRHLWMRNIFSTLPALAIDSVLFVSIAFYGESFELLTMIIYGQIVLKWTVGIVNIPFMYLNHFILHHGRSTPDRVLWDTGTGRQTTMDKLQ